MKIGLVPLSAKPYHAGHDALIRMASTECDVVHLFISTSDRKRKGELEIKGERMRKIWHSYIEPSLPINVATQYDCTPVKEVYVKMSEADETNCGDEFFIYSDEVDIQIYTEENLKKYVPNLFSRGLIIRRGVKRENTVHISGSKMRKFLQVGDFTSFSNFLPECLKTQSKNIIDILLQS